MEEVNVNNEINVNSIKEEIDIPKISNPEIKIDPEVPGLNEKFSQSQSESESDNEDEIKDRFQSKEINVLDHNGNLQIEGYKKSLPGSKVSLIPRNSFVSINSLNLQNFFTSKLTWEQDFRKQFSELRDIAIEEWKKLQDCTEKSLEAVFSFQKWIKAFGYQLISMSSVSFPSFESEQWGLSPLFKGFMTNNKDIITKSNNFGTLLSNDSRKLVNFSRIFGEFTQNLKSKHSILLKEFNKVNAEFNEKLEVLQNSTENYLWNFYNTLFLGWKCWCQLKTLVKELKISWGELEPLEKERIALTSEITSEFWENAVMTFNIEVKGPLPEYFLFEIKDINVPTFPEAKDIKLIKFRCNLVDKVQKELILSEDGIVVILDLTHPVPKPESKINLRGALVESRGVEVYIGSFKLKFETEEKAHEFTSSIGCI